jgi:CBS domain containing-hemolysin-like protein
MSEFQEILPSLVGLAILLLLSGFFSGSETALFSLTRVQVRRLHEGRGSERAAAALLRAPHRLLSSLLVGNMVVNIMFASVVASLTEQLFPEAESWAVAGAILTSTLLLMVFGELTPKTLAVHNPLPFALFISRPLLFFSKVISPIRWILKVVTSGLLHLVGQANVPGWGALTHAELAATLAAGEAVGATDAHERELVEHILKLGTVQAREIMVHRMDVVGLPDSLTVREAFAQACAQRRSRLPVYREGLDDIWGIVSTVDFPRWRDSELCDLPLAELRERVQAGERGLPVYQAHMAPETVSVERLLANMRALRTHFVVLVGEYGGTSGILTLDDIMGELMGYLPANLEGETTEPPEDGTIFADGRMLLRQLNEIHGVDLQTEEADTLGGFIHERLGRLARAGDEIVAGHHVLRVVRMSGRRVGMVHIQTTEVVDEDGEDES